MRVAMISEHASPLASLGSADAGGQNVYVDKLAGALAARGATVDVFTRRESPRQPAMVHLGHGVRLFHVNAGPAEFVPKEKMLPLMPAFEESVRLLIERGRYDVIHANFFMSALVAAGLKRTTGIPFVVTFHALGLVRQRHQGSDDGFPSQRPAIEREVIAAADAIFAECPQDFDDLVELYGAEPARIAIAGCGVDLSEFHPIPKGEARAVAGWHDSALTILQLGRTVPRKGIETVIRALAPLRAEHGIEARLAVVGGDSPTPDFVQTPELQRLADIAEICGVAEQVDFLGRRRRELLKYLYSGR